MHVAHDAVVVPLQAVGVEKGAIVITVRRRLLASVDPVFLS